MFSLNIQKNCFNALGSIEMWRGATFTSNQAISNANHKEKHIENYIYLSR